MNPALPLPLGMLRGLVVLALVSVALVLQTSVFTLFSVQGVVPDLVLLVVVGAGLVRGAEFAMVTGFVGGLLLDLAPPADHIAGRWALALVIAGYVAGRVHPDVLLDLAPGPRLGRAPRLPALPVLATVAAASFTSTSVYALSGAVLHDPSTAFAPLLDAVLIALVWDIVLTPVVLPPVLVLLRRLEPDRVRVGR